MKEHPILFRGEMVRSILDGRKTQTRRLIKPAPLAFDHQEPIRPEPRGSEGRWVFMAYSDRPSYQFATSDRRCPYGVPGDRLWVRETWNAIHVSVDPETGYGDDFWAAEKIPASDEDGYWAAVYAATDKQADMHKDDRGFVWRPGIHMPRWASRITLELTDVRVQRLQSISEEDAKAEGVDPIVAKVPTARDAFRLLWDCIHEKDMPWASNPWLWALTFKVVSK